MKVMSITNSFYLIKTAIDKSVVEVIKNQLSDLSLEEGLVFSEDAEESLKSVRKSKVGWVNSETWISGMMAHFVHVANRKLFQYDVVDWTTPIQYTVYDEYKSHYKWHTDISTNEEGLTRKLSISLCLSDSSDYTGGEFDIMPMLTNKYHSYKMDIGDAIVFSSDTMHRVRPVKSGKRISLVGWFGGPRFR